jgi:Spy/CpxP family protein refolding chaperone
MPLKDSKAFQAAIVLFAVVVSMGLIGVALSAQMGPGSSQGAPPHGPGGPGMHGPGGPGMMGHRGGMMGGPGGPGGTFAMMGRALRELNLTDEQREKVHAVMTSHQDEFKAVGERLRTAREELHAVVTSGAADEAAIRAKAEAVGAVEADAAVLHAKVHAEVWALLTLEQQQKAKELRSTMEQRMKERRKSIRQQVIEFFDETRGNPETV